ncbi:energy transducer TonB [Neiella marina]|nr:energy transducer TonB [Neiella marina]
MSYLVDNNERPEYTPQPTPVIDPVSKPKVTKPNEKQMPPEVKPVTPPPEFAHPIDPTDSTPTLAINAPQLPQVSINNGGIPAPSAPSDGDARPIVRVEPKYPIKQATAGITGYVIMQFSILADGSTGDIEVIESQPKRAFERAAMRALKKWKYRPKLVDGKSVIQQGLKVRLDFDLNQ